MRPTGARGEWKSHFWLPVKLDDAVLESAVAALTEARPDAVALPFDALHVSLSRYFTAAAHEIEPLAQRAKLRLGKMPAFVIALGPQLLELPSEDGLCTFGALAVAQGRHETNAMIDDLDEVLAAFGKPTYYTPRILHVSICRWPGAGSPVTYAPLDWPRGASASCRATRVLGRAGHVEFEIPLVDA